MRPIRIIRVLRSRPARSAHPARAALLALLVLAVSPTAARAADLHVATDAAAGGDGDAARPFARVQAAVDRAAPGDRVVVHAGIYREQISVRGGAPDHPLTILGQPAGDQQAEIRGSDVVGDFAPGPGPATWSHAPWTVDSQEVFVDGVALRRIGEPPKAYAGIDRDGSRMLAAVPGGAADLPAGSFIVADGALVVRLDDDGDPRGRLVEAATRGHLLRISGGDVRLERLVFRHSNTTAEQRGGAGVELGDRCVARGCVFAQCDFAGVALGWKKSGSRLEDCVASDNGCLGIGIDAHAGFVVAGCLVAGNNTRGFNPRWAAGGIKATTHAYGEVSRCVVRDNRGVGIWYDWCDSGQPSAVRGNRVSGNGERGAGIAIEGSADVAVEDDLVERNDDRGIYISASQRVVVARDTITGTRGFAALEVGGMPRAGRRLSDVTVRDVVIADNGEARFDLRFARENGDDIQGLALAHTLFWRGGKALAIGWGGDGRAKGQDRGFGELARWRTESGLGEGSVASDPRLDAEGRAEVAGFGVPAGALPPVR